MAHINSLVTAHNNHAVLFCSPDDVAELAVCAADSATTLLEITLADIPEVSVDYRGTVYGPGQVKLWYKYLVTKS